MKTTEQHPTGTEGVTIVDLSCRITLGDASVWRVTSTTTTSWAKETRKSCPEPGEVNYIDSSGIGVLVEQFFIPFAARAAN